MADEILLRAFPDLMVASHRHSVLVTDRTGSIGRGLRISVTVGL